MNLTVINAKLKDNRYISFLYDDNSIYAIGNSIESSNLNLEDVVNNILIGEIENGIEGINFKNTPPDLIKMDHAIKNYKEDIQNVPFVSFLKINKDEVLKDYMKTERTNITIKKAYKLIAKKRGMNISRFLDNKLKKEFNLKF